MELKDRIRQAMIDRGLKPVDLCKITGMGSSKISQILNGKVTDPRLSTAIKIADALNVSLDFLAGREEPKAFTFSDAETQRLADGFSQLNRDGRFAIKEQLDFQLAKNAKNEVVQDHQISGVA